MHRIQAFQCVCGVIQTVPWLPQATTVSSSLLEPHPTPHPPLAGQVLEQTHASEGVCGPASVDVCGVTAVSGASQMLPEGVMRLLRVSRVNAGGPFSRLSPVVQCCSQL